MDPAVATPASQLRDTSQVELKGMAACRFSLLHGSPGRVAGTLGLIAVLMFAFGFALVPLYDTFCRVLGLNGKVFQSVDAQSTGANQAEVLGPVTVEFVLTRNEGLDWEFSPLSEKLEAQRGHDYRVDFYARNNTAKAMTVQAVPNVTPSQSARFLIKAECFCFQQQTLAAGESITLPLIFRLDPELPARYRTMTLSYTLFDAGLERRSKR